MPGAAAETPAPYRASLTGAQIYCLAYLYRRLNQAYGPDYCQGLRGDILESLRAFVQLMPEPGEHDAAAYLRALDSGTVPNWAADTQALTSPAAAATRIPNGRPPFFDRWPGLAPAQAARYPVGLTAAQIFDFAGVTARLGRVASREQGGTRLRYDLWEALDAYAGLLPGPAAADIDPYLDAARAGRLPAWRTDAGPLTETPEQSAARARSRRAAEASAAGG